MYRVRISRLVIPTALVLLVACEGGPRISDENVRLVSYPKLQQMLTTRGDKGGVVLADVRPATEYAQSHIAGAVNVPLPEVRATHPALPHGRTVVVYGANWRQPISAAAVKRLVTQGREDVLDFRGGLEQWRERGGPIEPTNAPATQPVGAAFPDVEPATSPATP